jgi:hypothetical protein
VCREGGLAAIQAILAREVQQPPNTIRDKLVRRDFARCNVFSYLQMVLGKMAVRNIETWQRKDLQVEVIVRD